MDWLDRSHLVPLDLPNHAAGSVFEWALIEAHGWDRCKVLELRRDAEPVGLLGTRIRPSVVQGRQWRAMSSVHDWRIKTKFRGGSQYTAGSLADVWIEETVGGRNVAAAYQGAFWRLEPWSVRLARGQRLVQEKQVGGQLVLKSQGDQLSFMACTVNPIRWRSGGKPAYRIEFAGGGPEEAVLCLALCCFAAVALFHGGG